MQKNLKKLCCHPFVSKRFLLDYVEMTMFELMDFTEDEQKHSAINSMLRSIRQYIHSQEVNGLQQTNIETERKMWFLPSFTVDLINSSSEMEDEMYYIMNRLKAMGIRSSYVYFYGDGVSHKLGETFELPETIYLNAYYNENKMVYYKPKHRIPISTKSGDFMWVLQQDKARFYTAFVLFADVDHLKEINDCFGHAAGDFAITTAAEYLRQCTPQNAVIARIGGDEYVSMFVLDDNQTGEEVVTRIKNYAKAFNGCCDKDFYVEMSVGGHEFVCNPKDDIADLFKYSDAVLYEQKRSRRTSIKK